MSSQHESPPVSFSSTPSLLWHIYITHLWHPRPSSWVTKIAYSFRVLAFLVILPVLILSLLDITSYVIARTLGIVDDVKASTSDQPAVAARHTPAILVEESSSEGLPPAEHEHYRHTSPAHQAHNAEMSAAQEEMKPQAFFAGDEDLQLSSVGVFSPFPSQPSSPVLSDDKPSEEGGRTRVGDVVREPRDEDIVLRRRLQGRDYD